MPFQRLLPAAAVCVALAFSCTLPETPPLYTDAGVGGDAATGGSAGVSNLGGTTSGGTGGAAVGGSTSGGTATGGASTGGVSTGGTSTGGTATGGTPATGGSSGSGMTGGTPSTGGSAGVAGAMSGGTSGSGAGGRGGSAGGPSGGAGMSSGGMGGRGGSSGGGPVVELAEGRSATADSEENNTTSDPPKVNLAPSGNDGSASTRWCAADGGQHYWQVDLGASHELVRVEIDFEYPSQASGSAYGYIVGVSSDGSTFTAAIDQSANTSTTMTQTAQFPAATMGRHVRITVIPPSTTPSATWASFWEARIFGR